MKLKTLKNRPEELVELGAEDDNSLNTKEIRRKKKRLTRPLTPSYRRQSTNNPPAPLADLAAIVASWPSIPEPIKAAVNAILAPYLIAEAQK